MPITKAITDSQSGRWAFIALFVGAGALSFVAQAVLFREYLVLHQGSELSIGLFFGSWLLWVAVGAGLGRLPWLARAAAPRLALLACVHALAPLGQLWLLRSFRSLADVPAWELFPLAPLFGLTLLANAPASLVTGLLFVVASRVAGATVSRNYAAESLGSFLGGALVTALLVRGVGVMPLLVAAAAALMVAAIPVALLGRRRYQVATVCTLLAVMALGVIGGGLAWLERAAERARWQGVLPGAQLAAWKDTPQQHIALGRLGHSTVVTANGEVTHAFPDEAGRALDAAIIMTQRPRARRVLLIGDVAAGLLRHLLAYQPEQVIWLDPDPEATLFLRDHLLPADRSALAHRRLRVIGGDPRQQLTQMDGRFDLVLVFVADPDNAHRNRYFTQQFYRAVQKQLAAGGVLVTRVRSEVNYLASEVATFGASLVHTLRSVFARVLVTPGEQQWIFAGGPDAQVSLDGAEIARRYAAAGLRDPVFPAARLAGLWPPDRVAFVQKRHAAARSEAADTLLNTDLRPVSYFHALAYRLRSVGPQASRVLLAMRHSGVWLFLIPLLVLWVLAAHWALGDVPLGRRQRFNAVALVGGIGAVGMATQTSLMVAFQSRLGALFEQVGLVSALFVLGLASGSWLFARLVRRWPHRSGAMTWFVLGSAAALVASLPTAVARLHGADDAVAHGAYLALFVVAGLVTSASFPLAEATLAGGRSASAEVRGAIASHLGAADHWGGAVAALVCGALLVPLLGVQGTSWVLLVVLAVLAAWLLQQASSERTRGTRWGRWVLARARARSFGTLRLSYLMVGVALSALLVASLVRSGLDRPRIRFDATELVTLSKGAVFEPHQEPFVHYRVDPRGGVAAAAVAASRAVAPGVRGYGGPLNLMVDVDKSGRLRGVRLLESHETPAYVRGFGDWLAALKDRRVDRQLSLRTVQRSGPRHDAEVDVLTGATVTARAAIQAVNQTGAALASKVHGLRVDSTDQADPYGLASLLEPAALYLLVALALAVIAARYATARQRWIVLAANVVLGGIVFNAQLSQVDLARVVSGQLPIPLMGAVFVLFWGVVIVSLLFGSVYCGYACPFGAAQELLSKLGRPMRLQPGVEGHARYLKYVLLTVLVALFAFERSDALLAADPLRYQLGLQARGWALGLIVSIGAASLFVFRPWCRYLCPVGAALNLLNKLRLLARWMRPRRVGACDLGVASGLDVDCLQCDRCVTGTTMPPTHDSLEGDSAIRHPTRKTRSRWPFVGWVLVTVLLGVMVVRTEMHRSSVTAAGDRGAARDVPMARLLQRIEMKQLSQKPAMHAKPLTRVRRERR